MCILYLASLLCFTLNFYLVHGQEVCRTYPQGVLGKCLPVADCPRLNAILLQTRVGNLAEIGTLRKSVCAGNSTPLKICCESVASEPLSPSHGLPSNSDCGHEKLGDNIVGGQNADYWWPWIALLYGRVMESGRTTHFCGGSLITDRFIITAAHCKDPDIAIETAHIGELNTSTDPDTNIKGVTAPPVQKIPVADFIAHPQHNTSTCKRCNDIAIIKLAHPAILKDGFSSPICLPLHIEQDMKMSPEDYPGIIGTAAGWGATNKNPFDPQIPDHLQEVQLSIGSKSFCERVTKQHPNGSVICAGSGNGKDSCRGDSGGPLMVNDAFGIRWYLVGVTSFGPRVCGVQGTQGIYTSVHHYIPWIKENLK